MMALLVVLAVIAVPAAAHAHTPHDEITALRLSSAFWSDGTLFVIAREALLASYDAGRTWLRLTRGLPYACIRSLALSADYLRDRRVVVATDCGICLSDDAGESWRRARMLDPTDEQPPTGVREDAGRPLALLTADRDPGSSGMLCIQDGSLLASADRGATWLRRDVDVSPCTAVLLSGGLAYVAGGASEIVALDARTFAVTERWNLDGTASVTALAVPGGAEPIAGTNGNGLWRLGRGGKPVALGLPGSRITGIWSCADPSQRRRESHIAVTEWEDGVYTSSDAGRTWRLSARGLTRDDQADQPGFRVPHFKSIEGVEHPDGRRSLFVAGFDGLFRSQDGGASWQELENVITRDLVVGLATSQGDGADPQIAISLYGGGLHLLPAEHDPLQRGTACLRRTRTFAVARPPTQGSDGETWVAVHDAIHVVSSRGKRRRSAALSPSGAGPDRLRAGLRRRAAVPAKRLLALAPSGIRYRLRRLLQRRALQLRLEVGVDVFGSVLKISPRFSEDSTAFLSTWRGGIFRTTDAGHSFQHLWSPASGVRTLGIDLSPDFADDGRLYAATDDGLWISSTRGEAWSHPWNGAALRVAAGASGEKSHLLLVATPSALLRAEVASGHLRAFRRVLDCAPGYVVTDVAPAPDFCASGIVLVNQAGSGILRSSDGGASFSTTRLGEHTFRHDCAHLPAFPDGAPLIAFSPRFASDGIAFAASGAELFRSRDRGASWQPWLRFSGERPVEA